MIVNISCFKFLMLPKYFGDRYDFYGGGPMTLWMKTYFKGIKYECRIIDDTF